MFHFANSCFGLQWNHQRRVFASLVTVAATLSRNAPHRSYHKDNRKPSDEKIGAQSTAEKELDLPYVQSSAKESNLHLPVEIPTEAKNGSTNDVEYIQDQESPSKRCTVQREISVFDSI